MGVQILAELSSFRLQETDNAVAREMFSSVESQMLEEMGQSLLVIALVNGARLNKQTIDGLTPRCLVGIYIIGQSILQTPHAQLRVTGQKLC